MDYENSNHTLNLQYFGGNENLQFKFKHLKMFWHKAWINFTIRNEISMPFEIDYLPTFSRPSKKINIGTKLTIVSVYKLLFVRKKENKKQRCIKNSLLQKLLAKFFLYSSLNISDFRKLSRATSQFCIKRKKFFIIQDALIDIRIWCHVDNET